MTRLVRAIVLLLLEIRNNTRPAGTPALSYAELMRMMPRE